MKRHCFLLFAFLLLSLVVHAQESKESQDATLLSPPLPDAIIVPDGEMPPPPPPPVMSPASEEGTPHLPPPEFHDGPREGAPQKFFRELKKSNPEEYQRLMKLRMENREEFMKEMAKLMPHPKRDFDRKQFERDRECWELARKIRACENEGEKAALTAELEAKLSTMTDEMIADLQKRIKDMEMRLKLFQQKRDSIQKKRVKFFLEAPLPPENQEK